jgi:glycerol-3-phosphate dehydrogenase (NAD(P)+)
MKVGILGSGAWGLTLGRHLFLKGNKITIWTRRKERAEELSLKRKDDTRLPGIEIPVGIEITHEIHRALDSDYLVFAVPSHALREVAERIKGKNPKKLISVVKGIEVETGKRMSEILIEVLGGVKVAVLSGPSIALEVAQGKPTSVVIASIDEDYAREIQELFHSKLFRVYTSRDVIGVELGGALKNIIALAAGVADGLSLGANAKGALLTRGLAEIMRFGVTLGADPLTFSGLSGMGDLITTSFSLHSRNRYVGEELGKGRKLKDILGEMVMVAEGIKTTEAVYKLSKKLGVEMPLTEIVHLLLLGELSPKEALRRLMERTPKPEIYFEKGEA